MRKLWIQIMVILLLFVGVASADAPPMQTFNSTDGRFSVLLPGTPQQDSQTINLKGGGTTTLYQYWVEIDNNTITYMVMYNDYSAEYANGNAQAVLATTRDGAVKGKTLTSDVEFDLNGVPGRAFTASDDNGWNYSVHQFLNGKRLYQLIAVGTKDHPATLTDQFMNSFRML
jgi:hypothetical protein